MELPKSAMAHSSKCGGSVSARAKASAMTVLGLAFSVGASSALVPLQSASAAEDKIKAIDALDTPSLEEGAEGVEPEVVSAEETVAEETVAAAPLGTAVPTPAPSARTITVTHVVREGETLWSLAKRYSATPDAIARSNGLDADNLRVGQAINILTTERQHQLSKGMPLAAAALTSEEPASSGDKASRNLAQIQVEQAATSLAAAPEAASAPRLRTLQKGVSRPVSPEVSKALTAQKTVVVAGLPINERSLSQTINPAAEATFQASPAAVVSDLPQSSLSQPDLQPSEQLIADSSVVSALPTSTVGAFESETHVIGLGETVSSIAQAYGISAQELIELNGLRNPNRIFVGQTLKVPAVQQPEVALPQSVPDEPVRLAASLPIAIPAVETPVLPDAVRNSAEPVAQPEPPAALEGSRLESQAEPVGEVEDALLTDDRDLVGDGAAAREAVDSEAVDSETVGSETVDSEIIAREAPGPELVESELTRDAVAESEPAIAASNPYAEDLISDIEEIAEDVATEASGVPEAQVVQADVAPAEPELVEADDANPEFVASRQLSDTAVPTDEVVSALTPAVPEQPEALVASAPLGSENYVPLAEPVTGRMVSPELPPLSDPENHLPNASMPIDGYVWPAQGLLTSGYGWRWGRMHKGIDVAAPVGTPIVAAAPGVIEFSGWNSGGYGNMVDIRHADGNKTRYAHNSRNLVRVGQKVNQGEQIAEMGSTGYSTGPHVHFEIHMPDQGAVNPIAMLSEQ